MNERQITLTVTGVVCAAIILKGVHDIHKTTKVERSKRKLILDEVGLDVAAIHNATDVVNRRIERGEIRSMDELREAVLTEVAFQKITIREEG